MNQILAVKPGTLSEDHKKELLKQGFIVIECKNPEKDIKVINSYGDIPPSSLLACALEALQWGTNENQINKFAKLVAERSIAKIKSNS